MVKGTLLKIGTPQEVLSQKNLLLAGGLSLPPMLRISEGLKIQKCVTLEEVTRHEKVKTGAIMFSNVYGVLGLTKDAQELINLQKARNGR